MQFIKKLGYIFSKRQKFNFVILSLIILIGSGFELLGIAAIMPLVQIITDPGLIHSTPYYEKVYNLLNLTDDRQFILLFVACLVLIYVIKNIYILFMYSCQHRFTFNNQRRTSMRLMECYMSQPYIFHLSKNVSELQRNMLTDVEMLFKAVLSSVQLLSEGLTCFALSVYLIIIDKSISLGVIILLVIFGSIFLKFARKKSQGYGRIYRQSMADVNRWIRQSFEGIKEIKIANCENEYVKNVDISYHLQTRYYAIQSILNVSPRPVFEALCISSMLIVVGIKIYRGVDLQYFIPVLSAFAIAAFRVLPSFGRLTSEINSITYNFPAIDNVYHDLLEVDELQKKYDKRYNDKSAVMINNMIKVDKVTFSYPNIDDPVLKNASLVINKNKSVALIGVSGSGKTTLADVILGLLEPQKGHVYVDDVDIFEKPYGWHQILGYIPQSIYLIDDTIKNNILFGVSPDDGDDEKLIQVLKEAQLYDFVMGLEKGFDTIVGERGVRLSGGQRQRIGIARALYNDPQVLVLDEATSALDTETETAVMDAIDSLHGSRTMIIIAHRLTTIRNCDEIYEVVDGQVVKRSKSEVLNNE